MKHETGMARLFAVIRRRRWPVVVTALATAAVGLYLVKSLVPLYEARAVVRIDDPRPARDYVPPLTTEPDADRLKSTRLGILAQPLIAEAAEKVRLIAPDAKDRPRRLLLTTARVDARQEGEDIFVVTFQDEDPARARAFLDALIAGYAQHRAAEQSGRAAATAMYLAGEVEALRPRVAKAEAALERARTERYGALPEQLEANLRVLDDNEMSVHALISSLDAAQARRRDILADVQSPLRHQEEAVARDLSAARTRYAANAPEIQNLEAELARVRNERASDEGSAARRLASSAELRAANEQVKLLQGQIADLQKRDDELRAHIAAAAKNGEQLATLALDRDVLRERLKTLVGKHEEAALAAGLEAGVSGRARVTVVEPPWTPPTPAKPAKPLFGLAALALAVLLGLGVGFLLDALDKRVLAVEDVRALTGDLPLLGVVPRLARPGRAANGNLVRAAAAAGSDE
jgi:uncharacterized protein involved in exopolysaccharide biosynthesis